MEVMSRVLAIVPNCRKMKTLYIREEKFIMPYVHFPGETWINVHSHYSQRQLKSSIFENKVFVGLLLKNGIGRLHSL